MKLDLFSVPIFIENINTSKINVNNINFEKTWNSQTISSFNFANTINNESEALVFNSNKKHFGCGPTEGLRYNLNIVFS